MALGQTACCPRVNRAKKFMCSPRNTVNINFSLWLTGGSSQCCPDVQKVYVFKVYVPFLAPKNPVMFFVCGLCSEEHCKFCNGMVASPLTATMVIAILCDVRWHPSKLLTSPLRSVCIRRRALRTSYCRALVAV